MTSRSSVSDLLAPVDDIGDKDSKPDDIIRGRSTTPTVENPKGKTQTIFIHKLYDMLQDTTISHLIWWADNNVSFYIIPGEEFSKVLAQYFKHTNIASFIRQLNMYGFHKVNDSFTSSESAPSSPASSGTAHPIAKWEFRHSSNQFRKGDLESLKLIKRRSLKNINSHKEVVNIKSIPTSNPYEESSSTAASYDTPSYQEYPYYQSSQPLSQPLALSLPQQVIHPSAPPQNASTGISEDIHLSRSQSLPTIEQSLNFKIIELTNNYNTLRGDYCSLQAKYDMVCQDIKKTQRDLINFAELIEKVLPAKPEVKNDYIDRSKNRTPTTILATEDSASPTTKPPAPAPHQLVSEFKNRLLDQFTQKFIQSQKQHQSNNISRHSSNPNFRHASNSSTNIVPQHYPLNPNYTVYHEVAFRNVNLTEDGHSNRHLSVLMDPLQPMPEQRTSGDKPDKMSQYPFPIMPPFSNRTNSLPSFEGQQENNVQRHSLTSLNSDTSLHNYAVTPTLDLSLQGKEPPRSVPLHTPSTIDEDEERPKNQLPSVQELDKSIKTSQAPVFNLLNTPRSSIGAASPKKEDDIKRRKFE